MMNDLISRQAAIDALDGNVIVTSRESAQAVMDYIRGCADRIRALPSAQPEIIRCKDCRYAHLTRDGKCKYCDTWTDVDGYPLDLYVEGEFYCGNAERRTDG